MQQFPETENNPLCQDFDQLYVIKRHFKWLPNNQVGKGDREEQFQYRKNLKSYTHCESV